MRSGSFTAEAPGPHFFLRSGAFPRTVPPSAELWSSCSGFLSSYNLKSFYPFPGRCDPNHTIL